MREISATMAYDQSCVQNSQLYIECYKRVWSYIYDTIEKKDKYVNMVINYETEEEDEIYDAILSRLIELGFEARIEQRGETTYLIINWKKPNKSKTTDFKEIDTLEDLI